MNIVYIVYDANHPRAAFAEEKAALSYRDWLRNLNPRRKFHVKELKVHYGQIV